MRFASDGVLGQQVHEFKSMVKTLHRGGIEVIVDVVYNHTGEDNHLGRTICFRGVNDASYYRLTPHDPRFYTDYTGCGNTLNMAHPRTLQLIMDSLCYWILKMDVDGFQFHLASALARELHDVDRPGAFFDIIHQDSFISEVKLIAEPWDLGEGGYQVENFPVLWDEWNGEYRDTVRRFIKGDDGQMAAMGYCLTGSSDLYGKGGRRPYASINFVTTHDGFILRDLVTNNEKHNERNGEENRDGTDNNLSWSCGAEGPADDPAILALRERQKRNFLATLLLSQGVPVLCGGDEIGRTQDGNNNASCQDNELSWFEWKLDKARRDLLTFTRSLVRRRREHPVLRRRQFFYGRHIHGSEMKDLAWLRPDGKEMTKESWLDPRARCISLRLAGDAIDAVDAQGEPITDDPWLILLNAYYEPLPCTLPAHRPGVKWELVPDTRSSEGRRLRRPMKGGETYDLEARCVAVLLLRRKT